METALGISLIINAILGILAYLIHLEKKEAREDLDRLREHWAEEYEEWHERKRTVSARVEVSERQAQVRTHSMIMQMIAKRCADARYELVEQLIDADVIQLRTIPLGNDRMYGVEMKVEAFAPEDMEGEHKGDHPDLRFEERIARRLAMSTGVFELPPERMWEGSKTTDDLANHNDSPDA